MFSRASSFPDRQQSCISYVGTAVTLPADLNPRRAAVKERLPEASTCSTSSSYLLAGKEPSLGSYSFKRRPLKQEDIRGKLKIRISEALAMRTKRGSCPVPHTKGPCNLLVLIPKTLLASQPPQQTRHDHKCVRVMHTLTRLNTWTASLAAVAVVQTPCHCSSPWEIQRTTTC